MKVFRISGRDRNPGGRLVGPQHASMKVFRISGRDDAACRWSLACGIASMKVFRISGRDWFLFCLGTGISVGLNESLPHKRKRPKESNFTAEGSEGLNESLPHKRKRRVGTETGNTRLHHASMKVFRISGRDGRTAPKWPRTIGLNESLPHKRKRLGYTVQVVITHNASMKVFRISGRDYNYCCRQCRRLVGASMKVFRISGRDFFSGILCASLLVASMKVFRISGRDRLEFLVALNCQNCKLSER